MIFYKFKSLVTPVGTTLSGKLLYMNPLFSNKQLHNYVIVFLIAALINFLSLIWVCTMINEQKDRKQFYDKFSHGNNQQDIELSNVTSEPQDVSQNKTKNHDGNHYKEYENQNPIKLLFDFRNVIEIVRTCLKKRSNLVRAQIWLLFLSTLLFNTSTEGINNFLFQFAEKVYQWNGEQFSYASSIFTLVMVICMMTVIPLIIKVIN